MHRPPAIHHCSSQPLRFFGRDRELAILDESLAGGPASVVAFVGPGGQGKTAIVQHWMRSRADRLEIGEGFFFWSFYRGKDSDLCLRQLFAYAEGLEALPEVSASFCVDRLVPRLRRERWAIVFDGAEVVQHEQGAWQGRFIHPELARLIETLAEAPMPGVLVVTSRFALPTLATRRHGSIHSLGTLDLESSRSLLTHLGVAGDELTEAAAAAGGHAKAVELLGVWLSRFHQGQSAAWRTLPELPLSAGSDEERHVLRVLSAFHHSLGPELKDILALANNFHQPPTESSLNAYLQSESVRRLLHETWQRAYVPFRARPTGWLAQSVRTLVDLRLLERVHLSLTHSDEGVLDAHPLVRRGFEQVLGGDRPEALARAGFLRGRPNRARPATLIEAREEVELFHAYCDAGLWNEADSTFVALDNPKHRFLAPAFERDLLLRFFPEHDGSRPPLWPGFGRYRSLAICHEMLGQFEAALETYRPDDAPLKGDALIALGRLEPLLIRDHVPHPWQALWQAYCAHALALAGRRDEALRAVRACWPQDIYEWVHVFETLLRLDRLDLFDPRSLDASLRGVDDSRWTQLARRRLLADFRRRTGDGDGLDGELRSLTDAYDRAGLPLERVLVRLSHARLLRGLDRLDESGSAASSALEIAQRHAMTVFTRDAQRMLDGDDSDARP